MRQPAGEDDPTLFIRRETMPGFREEEFDEAAGITKVSERISDTTAEILEQSSPQVLEESDRWTWTCDLLLALMCIAALFALGTAILLV